MTPGRLIGYFLRLGATGFGGPIALVGAMHRDLVELRGWISEDEYREGMALAQLAPGPLAAQLCCYIGYVRGGVTLGAGTVLGFVLPSFLVVLGLAWAYVRLGGLPWMQAVFYGVGAAALGLIARSATRLTLRVVGREPVLWLTWLVLAVTTAATGRELPWLIVLGGAAGWLGWALSGGLGRPGVAAEGGSVLVLLQLLGFFGYAGAFVFGSGLAIVPFLHGGVVLEHRWLTEAEFLDAVAVAMITPGPVVIATGFIGYLVAGVAGGVVAAGATLLPCFLFTVVPARWFRRYGARPGLRALVGGVTAAATGAIAGAVVVLGRGWVRDGPTALIAVLALWISSRFRRVPEPALIVAAGVAGLVLRS